MNTSSEAIKRLQEAMNASKSAEDVVDNLIAEHDYQDIASLITKAATALLETAALLMQEEDETALNRLEDAENLLDTVWETIDGEVDED